MKTRGVNNNQVPAAIVPPKKNVKGATAKADKNSVKSADYNVKLSPDAKNLNEVKKTAFDTAKMTGGIRESRVAELKDKIKSGTYKPEAGKIADGMLQEAIRDQVAMSLHNEAKRR